MAQTYEISSELLGIQNMLLKNTIKQNTNVELLQSEEAVRDLYASYADKIKRVGGKLFTLSDHSVSSKDVITKAYFDELFQDIYNDVHALYINVQYIDDLLDINLAKNKKFYSTLEKRILELESKLDVARLNVNSIVAFDKVFFEGFNNNTKDAFYYNMDLDKKTGHLSLKAIDKKYLNKKYNIKKVASTLYPVPNNDGGVIVTTHKLNTFDESYRLDGQNDMLEKGLWKEQVFTNEIPDVHLEINKNRIDGPNFKIQTQGIVSYVDIEFKYMIDFNTLEIDLFGEYDTSILMVLHKENEEDAWDPISKLKKDLLTDAEEYIDDYGEVTAFNIVSLRNLELTNTKFIRIIFNQKNYSIIGTGNTEIHNAASKINDDLSERRLEVIKLDGGSDGKPAIPKTFHYNSFYSELVDIIEGSANVNTMLKELVTKLEPTNKLITQNFKKTLKYELGAWSIEPKMIQYQGVGKYQSVNYNYTEKPTVGISLYTEQQDIKSNTCNWYISDIYNKQVKPIVPNDEIIRKETIHVVSNQYYIDKGWTDGTLVQLDFPINLSSEMAIVLYEDGVEIAYTDMVVYLLSTQLLFIQNIKDPSQHKYVIKYIPAKFDIVNVYTLYNTKNYTNVNDSLEYNIIAPRESILKLFLDKTGLNDHYTIKRSICSSDEYSNYFEKNTKNLCINSSYYSMYKTVIDTYLYPNSVNEFRDNNSGDVGTVYDQAEVSAIPLVFERTI